MLFSLSFFFSSILSPSCVIKLAMTATATGSLPSSHAYCMSRIGTLAPVNDKPDRARSADSLIIM